MHDLLQKAVALNNAHIEQFKFLRVVCAWTYLKKSLNVSNITYFYPNTNNPEEFGLLNMRIVQWTSIFNFEL